MFSKINKIKKVKKIKWQTQFQTKKSNQKLIML